MSARVSFQPPRASVWPLVLPVWLALPAQILPRSWSTDAVGLLSSGVESRRRTSCACVEWLPAW